MPRAAESLLAVVAVTALCGRGVQGASSKMVSLLVVWREALPVLPTIALPRMC